jgi:hypothetical protein
LGKKKKEKKTKHAEQQEAEGEGGKSIDRSIHPSMLLFLKLRLVRHDTHEPHELSDLNRIDQIREEKRRGRDLVLRDPGSFQYCSLYED